MTHFPLLVIVDLVLALLPKVAIGIDQARDLYRALQDVFGSDVLPDKSDAEIAQLGADGFAALKARVAALRAGLEPEQPQEPEEPPAAPTEG